MTSISTASVATARPERYAKQLVSHMSRKVPATWDEDAGTGRVTFPSGVLDLGRGQDALLLTLTAEADLERWEGVVGSHLVRFGTRDELVVAWQRDDGTPGTVQRKTED
ncbi:MAG: DUF2218 domain-containing protein [Micropruina sp.]|uniref:DUF2218 domain-containing protein n=1 Tax=Micropruina sp. TaxID=2737536 RepID=UPI0039E4788E